MLSIFYYYLKGNVEAQTTQSKTSPASKEQELRTMLKTVLEQNRRLVLQNNRLQQVNICFSCEIKYMPFTS